MSTTYGLKQGKPGKAKPGTSKEAALARKIAFADAYIANDENGTQAAITAGFSEKTAYSQASRLLKDVQVKQIIEDRRAALRKKYQLTTENVIRELSRIAFFDPRKLYDENGNVKPIHELDDDTAAALASFEVLEEFDGTGEKRKLIGYTKKFKAWDKNSAIEKAMKHLGQFQKDNEQTKPEMPEESKSTLDAARRIAFVLAQGAAMAKKNAKA